MEPWNTKTWVLFLFENYLELKFFHLVNFCVYTFPIHGTSGVVYSVGLFDFTTGFHSLWLIPRSILFMASIRTAFDIVTPTIEKVIRRTECRKVYNTDKNETSPKILSTPNIKWKVPFCFVGQGWCLPLKYDVITSTYFTSCMLLCTKCSVEPSTSVLPR